MASKGLDYCPFMKVSLSELSLLGVVLLWSAPGFFQHHGSGLGIAFEIDDCGAGRAGEGVVAYLKQRSTTAQEAAFTDLDYGHQSFGLLLQAEYSARLESTAGV